MNNGGVDIRHQWMHKNALIWQRDSETFVRLAKGNFTKAEDGILADGIHTILHMISYTHIAHNQLFASETSCMCVFSICTAFEPAFGCGITRYINQHYILQFMQSKHDLHPL